VTQRHFFPPKKFYRVFSPRSIASPFKQKNRAPHWRL
jgi:hypothetical protein